MHDDSIDTVDNTPDHINDQSGVMSLSVLGFIIVLLVVLIIAIALAV